MHIKVGEGKNLTKGFYFIVSLVNKKSRQSAGRPFFQN